jgi:hypothetical protein
MYLLFPAPLLIAGFRPASAAGHFLGARYAQILQHSRNYRKSHDEMLLRQKLSFRICERLSAPFERPITHEIRAEQGAWPYLGRA